MEGKKKWKLPKPRRQFHFFHFHDSLTSCPSFSTDGVWDLGKLLPAAVNHKRDQRAHSVPHPQTGTFGGQREAFLAFLRAGTSKSEVYGNKTHSKPLVLHHVARRENPVQAPEITAALSQRAQRQEDPPCHPPPHPGGPEHSTA